MQAKKQTKRLLNDGGLLQQGGTVDAESGNEVPVGSLQEEVRDDIPAQLSEGEFVFPADVVRFIGLERLMQMRQAAKEGLSKMEAMGQMGNAEEATEDDDGNFETEIDDIVRDVEQDEAFEAYVGGAVTRRKKYAEGGMVEADPAVAQMETGAMTTPATMSNSDIIRQDLEANPEKETQTASALEDVYSDKAVMVRESNSVFVLSTVTPGIIRMNTFTMDSPEALSAALAKTLPVLRASKVNGVEVAEDNPNIRAAFEAAGFKTLDKEEGVFVVDLTKRV